MITRFRVQNYKALRDVTLDLTPIHVLIGPNDTGKTSILEAVAALCRSVDHELGQAFTGRWQGCELVWESSPELPISLHVGLNYDGRDLAYTLICQFTRTGRLAKIVTESTSIAGETVRMDSQQWPESRVFHTAVLAEQTPENMRKPALLVYEALRGVHYYRWNPRLLSLPVAPDSRRRFRMEQSGFGLALCLDDILGYDRGRFIDLERQFCDIFGQIRSVKLVSEMAYRSPVDDAQQIPMLQQAEGKGIYFQFKGNEALIPASQVSDGILLVLAYLTILHLPQPPRVILVEEPENGIHPRRLRDVLGILKDLVKKQSHTQVILTTHSPYVVDMFDAGEVSICTKNEDGSVSVHRLSDSKTVREQLDVFTLGEIWTAEGDEALVKSTRIGEGAGQ